MKSRVRKFVQAAIAGLAVWVLSASALARDTVYLRTGEVFTGKILRITEKELSIQLESGGAISIKANRVVRVRRWLPGRDSPEIIDLDHQDDAPLSRPPSGPPGPPPIQVRTVKSPGDQPTRGSRTGDEAVVRNWDLDPPPGFKEVEKKPVPPVVKAWEDPVVQATVVLAAHGSDSTPEQLKEKRLEELGEPDRFRVIRDQATQRGGRGSYKGWILELEHIKPRKSFREIQLFTRSGDRAYVLTFLCPTADYPALARFFEESLQSFRVFEPSASTARRRVPGN